MDDLSEAPARRRPIPRLGRSGRLALAIALILLLALVALWLIRKPVATHFIDRTFASRGVPARYRIADLGFGRQRLTDVVIGDPARPDLVADWIETETSVGLAGPSLTGLRAGSVRLRGRLLGGKLSLGVIDRLLPPPSGKPFALPRLALDVADGRMRLETPFGLVGIKLSGSGRLDDGFDGRVAMVSEQLELASCSTAHAAAAGRLRTARGAPSFAGPIRSRWVQCGLNIVWLDEPGGDLQVALSPTLDRWQGGLRFATGTSHARELHWYAGRGTIDFAGTAAATRGRVAAAATGIGLSSSPGRAGRLTIDGGYRIGNRTAFDGLARVERVELWDRTLRPLDRWRVTGAGTPVAPLADALIGAIRRAGRMFDAEARVTAAVAGGGATVHVADAVLAAASGARLSIGGDGITIDPDGRYAAAATVRIGGGGLPSGTVAVRSAPGRAVTGTARFAAYAAGGARLALGPVSFSATPRGNTRIRTRIDLTGPLANGGVERLTFPIDGLWDGRGRFAINPDCTPLSFQRLAAAGLVLDPARLTLCPTGSALVTLAGGRLGGGARLAATRLTGRLGGTPLTVAATGATVALGDRGFAVHGLATRLGNPARVTRLDIATLTGRIDRAGLTGSFAGGAGQIANVPLLIAGAAGDWSLRGGALALTGTLGVSDAQATTPRFRPMAARDVALWLAGGQIVATGVLAEPSTGTKVADLRMEHVLASGSGHADLGVPGLVFAKGFQPELLTPLTYGVIADVKGTVGGQGRIDWSPRGVSSTGTFRTAGTDLAAAFGPVTGIAGEIRFTDLLALRSAPGQIATVKSINPGIVVGDGRIVFQTLPNTQVRVERGRWPFAGGTLTLEPTLLDFSAAGERRMTFRVDGAAADQFLQQFDFKNLDATGVFDGELPMVFDTAGGRIENGRLVVRPGGGGLAYNGEVSDKNLGFWGNFAFGALKSLRYRSLSVVMNGPLAGEMVTEVKFAGVSQGEGAKSNFLIRRLQRLPIVFNIRIKAPFRGLLDSAQSFYDPSRLIQRNLPSLIEQQKAAPPVQPPASGTVP